MGKLYNSLNTQAMASLDTGIQYNTIEPNLLSQVLYFSSRSWRQLCLLLRVVTIAKTLTVAMLPLLASPHSTFW